MGPLDEPAERDASPVEVRRRFDGNIKLRPVAVDARARHRQQPGLGVRHEEALVREERPVRERAARAAGRVREGASQQAHALHDAARERRFDAYDAPLGASPEHKRRKFSLVSGRSSSSSSTTRRPACWPSTLTSRKHRERACASGASQSKLSPAAAGPEEALRAARGVALVPAARVRAERAAAAARGAARRRGFVASLLCRLLR